jgi:hypothetical protein
MWSQSPPAPRGLENVPHPRPSQPYGASTVNYYQLSRITRVVCGSPYPLSSGKGSTSTDLKTFVLKIAQAKTRIWP